MKETTEVVLAGVALANGVGKAAGDDGKIDITDTIYLMDFVAALPAAATGSEKIPGEIAGLTAEQRAALIQTVKDKFDIPQDRLEGFVERAMDWAVATADLVSEGKALLTDG